MNLIKLMPPDASASCGDDDDCPAVYIDTESDDAVIQGDMLIDPAVKLPHGEGRLRVPRALLCALAPQLAAL